MKYKFTILICSWLLLSATVFAQSDVFSGNWHMDYSPAANTTISIDLNIAAPENNLLFPAELIIQSDSFTATYHLLLVKRNIRQLAIGKNKFPSSESPFVIGNWAIYLNGLFDLSRDQKGNLQLQTERLVTRQLPLEMPLTDTFPAEQKITATHVRNLFMQTDLILKKASGEAWESPYTDSILSPQISPAYFSIMDTIIVTSRDGTLSFAGNKKNNTGVVSVTLNGNTIIDLSDLTVKKIKEDIRLDTGLNILVLFADKFGKNPAKTANLQVSFKDRSFAMDFGSSRDIAATYIVAKIYYSPGKENENTTPSENSILRELSEKDLLRDIELYYYPDITGRNLLKNDTAKARAETALLRTAIPVGNIKASAREIILALWDDAVEDGDSISLNINGKWVVQGFPVKKQPQFISVKLDGGPNKIIFIADNLGSIPPNTTILEIIDGRQRRSFMIDTNLGQNNLINILYDVKDP